MSIIYPLYVKDVVNQFNLQVILNEDKIDSTLIKLPDITRCSFELTGEHIFEDIWNVIYIGRKESLYLQRFSLSIIEEKLSFIITMKPPMIILGPDFAYESELLKVARNSDVPIVKSEMNLQALNFTITTWMTEKLAPYTMYHGCLVNVFGLGTLILGESGIGKSEITLELVKNGHIFVADDAILISRIGPNVFGKPDDLTKDYIEIRGLGILSFSRTFGIEKQINSTKIDVVCELINVNKEENKHVLFERLGQQTKYIDIEGVKLPYYKIPVLQGRNTSDLIETSVIDLKLKKQGFNSANEFINQINNFNSKNKK